MLVIYWDANDLHSNPMPNAKLQRPDAKLLLRLNLLRLNRLWLIRLRLIRLF